jgi:hypothetical protein
MNEALVDAYDWNRFGTLVDVAGGVGSTLAAILRANLSIQGCCSTCLTSSNAAAII